MRLAGSGNGTPRVTRQRRARRVRHRRRVNGERRGQRARGCASASARRRHGAPLGCGCVLPRSGGASAALTHARGSRAWAREVRGSSDQTCETRSLHLRGARRVSDAATRRQTTRARGLSATARVQSRAWLRGDLFPLAPAFHDWRCAALRRRSERWPAPDATAAHLTCGKGLSTRVLCDRASGIARSVLCTHAGPRSAVAGPVV